MPCYTINIVSVEFQPQNAQLLEKTIKELGWRLLHWDNPLKSWTIQTSSGRTITIKNGKAEGEASEINQLRVKYSQVVLEHAAVHAKAKGWMVSKNGPNKLTVRKGSGGGGW